MAVGHVGIGKAGDVAERSPTVYSANVKEEILLRRRLLVLDRSERSVVHRIKVDQKVIYKRFQARLARSKLAFARIMKQKDVERDMRVKNVDGLNTYIPGRVDEDFGFLDKLEKRPCTASCYSPRRQRRPKPPPGGLLSSILQETPEESKHKPRGGGRPQTVEPPRPPRVLTDAGSGDCKSLPPRMSTRNDVRPATTIGSRVDDEPVVGGGGGVEGKVVSNVDKDNNKSEKMVETDRESSSSVNEHDRKGKSIVDVDAPKNNADRERIDNMISDKVAKILINNTNTVNNNLRPKTVTTFAVAETTPPPSPRQTYSRRASKAAEFFQEEDKVDLVKLRLMEARSQDYTDKVRKFCQGLEGIGSSHHKPNADYYTIRQQALQSSNRKASPCIDETPEADDRKATGNIHVRSLTVPSINWDFHSDGVGV